MDQFMGDIAAILEVALIGLSFVVLYFAYKEKSRLMKIGGYVLLVGGVLGLACTSYWWFKYYQSGVFTGSLGKAMHYNIHQ